MIIEIFEGNHILHNNDGKFKKPFNYSIDDFFVYAKSLEYETYMNKYRGNYNRVCEADNLPYLIDVFQLFFYENSRPPQVDEFVKTYLSYFEVVDKDNIKYGDTIFSKKPLVARLLRSFPSLVRDLNALCLLIDNPKFFNVYYSTFLDKKGTDIKVLYDTYDFHLRLFLDSKRSNSFLNKKNNIHYYNGKNMINWPIQMDTKIGDMNVISQQSFEYLINTLDGKVRSYRRQ